MIASHLMDVNQKDLLHSTKPLADPLKLCGGFFLFAGFGNLFLGLADPAQIYASLAAAAFSLALGLLVFPIQPPNAFYLRSFRSDHATAKLRKRLESILGPGFRLTGIRPPRAHSAVFIRFFAPGLFALRYLGSKYMELESGDNWMARLWKSYQQSRIAFIDLRDITEQVHNEIVLTLLTLGKGRCVFLIDGNTPRGKWHEILNEALGTDTANVGLHLLDVSEAKVNSGEMAVALKQILKTLPNGVVGASDHACDFLLSKVSAETLKESQSTATSTLSALSGALLLGILIVAAISAPALGAPLYVTSILTTGLLLHGILYGIARAWRYTQENGILQTGGMWLSLVSVVLLLALFPVLQFQQARQDLEPILATARNTQTLSNARSVMMASLMHEADHGKLPESVDALATGEKPYLTEVVLDAWQRPFLILSEEEDASFLVQSAGADGALNTADDIILGPQGIFLDGDVNNSKGARWLQTRKARLQAEKERTAREGQELKAATEVDPKDRDTDGNTPLHKMAESGNQKAVAILLERGASPNVTNKAGETPLVAAVRIRNAALVEVLLKHGAHADAKDKTGEPILMLAVNNRDIESVRCLLQNGASANTKNSSGRSALAQVIIEGLGKPLAELLIKHGAETKAVLEPAHTLLHVLALNHDDDAMAALLIQSGVALESRNSEGETVLLTAVINRREGLTRFLLQQNASLSVQGEFGKTPLHFAAMAGRPEIIRALLDHGAAIEARDNNGNTPLHWAPRGENPAVVKLLLDRGAAVNARNAAGETPLFVTAGGRQWDMTQILLQRGAEVNALDRNQRTPLHAAAASFDGSLDNIRLLLDSKADIHARDANGITPLSVASSDEIKSLLRSRGAKD
jgi:ankyrin repeat protein